MKRNVIIISCILLILVGCNSNEALNVPLTQEVVTENGDTIVVTYTGVDHIIKTSEVIRITRDVEVIHRGKLSRRYITHTCVIFKNGDCYEEHGDFSGGLAQTLVEGDVVSYKVSMIQGIRLQNVVHYSKGK